MPTRILGGRGNRGRRSQKTSCRAPTLRRPSSRYERSRTRKANLCIIQVTPLEIITALSTASKSITAIAKGANNADLNKRVIELQSLIFQLQGVHEKQQDEIRDLKETIRHLERTSQIQQELVFEESVYWRPRDGKRDGPFCPNCWDLDKKLVRLNSTGEQGFFRCPIHKHPFYTAEYRDPGESFAIVSMAP